MPSRTSLAGSMLKGFTGTGNMRSNLERSSTRRAPRALLGPGRRKFRPINPRNRIDENFTRRVDQFGQLLPT